MADQHERRIVARVRVNELLGRAALDNDVAAYLRERREMLALIARTGGARGALGHAVRSSRPFGGLAVRTEVTCPECLAADASPEESFLLHSDPDAPDYIKQPAMMPAGERRDPGISARSELMRDYPLEDLHIVRSARGGGARTMEAYAAVFNTETAIRDHQGDYVEVIDPAAFNRRLAELRRSRKGVGQVKVMFNHGRDMEGNLAERFQMPVAVPVSIEADSRGLLTRSRFVETPLGDEVLELVNAGAVTAMSFIGAIMRSAPQPSRGGRYRPDGSGRLTTVRRMELGLREFGPVLFPAYEGAEINGVRSAGVLAGVR